jgi:putative spermidine/putrescine transport system substrate-binding protein
MTDSGGSIPSSIISRRKFAKIGSAAVAATTLSVLLGGCSTQDGGGDTPSIPAADLEVDTDFGTMTWDEILAEAKGQTVTFLAWGSGGADTFVQQWWEALAEYAKSTYDVDLQFAEYSSAEYEKLTTDLANGADATYDLFWFTGAMIDPVRKADGVFTDFVEKLPNSQYLDYNNSYVTFDGVTSTDDLEVPFQTCNPQIVYPKGLWSAELPWDASEGSINGLFHDFTELSQWVKKHPGKFTYMDLTGAGGFHGQLFAKAILSELTDDGNGGWKTVYDEADSADARRTKIQKNIEDWYAWSISTDASEEAFYTKAGYLWAFLNELKPNLLQGDSGPLYMATAPDMMGYVKSGDLACTFTTCTSISSRVAATPDAYMEDPAIYMLQTSIGYWDYAVIMRNSKNKAGALAICNALLDPGQQIKAFDINGNGYTVDYDRLDASQKSEFDGVLASMGSLSPSAADVAQKSYVDKYGVVVNWITSGWDQYVNKV